MAHPEGAQHQAVGAQALDEGAAQAVPAKIAEEQIAPALHPFPVQPQGPKANEIPQGFIKERGHVGVYFIKGRVNGIPDSFA